MSKACVDPSQPYTLLCFEAHETDLQKFHLDQLQRIAEEVVASQRDKRPINLIRVTGHAATWRGITKTEYWRRGTVRANNATFFLLKALHKAGVDLSKMALAPGSEGDLNPVHSNSTQEGRALNRRVEITLERAIPPSRRKAGKCVEGEKIKAAPIEDVAADNAGLRRLKCLQSFLIEALCGTIVDGRYWHFRRAHAGIGFGVTRQKTPSDIVKDFRRNFDVADAPKKVAQNIKNRHDALLGETNKLLGYLVRDKDNAPLVDTPECAWLLEFAAASARRSPKSVYRCIKKELESAVAICLP